MKTVWHAELDIAIAQARLRAFGQVLESLMRQIAQEKNALSDAYVALDALKNRDAGAGDT